MSKYIVTCFSIYEKRQFLIHYSIYCNTFTQYIILYIISNIPLCQFNILIIHVLGNIFSLRRASTLTASCSVGNANNNEVVPLMRSSALEEKLISYI